MVTEKEAVDHRIIALLGIETICVYGAWWYSFGVLLDPILADTGWSETAVAGAFSLGVVVVGIGSIFGGRLLDRFGLRPVFITAGVIGGTGMAITSLASNVVVFALGTASALGAFGALGFYHITMTAAVRSNPESGTRAIAVLTIWGALASAIYIPLAAWLVETTDWRVSVRILGATAVVSLVVAAIGAPIPADTTPGDRPSLRTIMGETWRSGKRRGFTITVGLGGISFTTLLVYQVPVMVAAGLPLTTAATAAAVRGFCQLGGRLPLTPLINRLGSGGAVMIALAAIGTGALILIVSGTFAVAMIFAVVAGFGIGAWSPLQGIRSNELFDQRTLGATMGFFATVASTAGALGPVLAGFIADTTGDRRWGAVMSAAAAGAALLVFAVTQRDHEDRPGALVA